VVEDSRICPRRSSAPDVVLEDRRGSSRSRARWCADSDLVRVKEYSSHFFRRPNCLVLRQALVDQQGGGRRAHQFVRIRTAIDCVHLVARLAAVDVGVGP